MDPFTALAIKQRRDIVILVAKRGELTASDISRRFSISAPAISQHLKVLREANILQMKRNAQQRIYSVNRDAFEDIEGWLNAVKAQWDQRLDKMDRYTSELKKERSRGKR